MLPSIEHRIAAELGIRPAQVNAAIALLDEGATVPFISRYRKEATDGLDDTELRKRWSGFADTDKRMSERAGAWRAMLNGAGAEWHDAARPVTR